MKKRNYFEILNLSLNPLETNVDNALARLKQCAAEWSSAPQDDVLRKTWMEAVPEMEKVLSNPQSLLSQAKEALKNEQKRVKISCKMPLSTVRFPRQSFGTSAIMCSWK